MKKSCENCRLDKICKYCEDMKEKEDRVMNITSEPLSPVEISVTCNSFESRKTKQDRIISR